MILKGSFSERRILKHLDALFSLWLKNTWLLAVLGLTWCLALFGAKHHRQKPDKRDSRPTSPCELFGHNEQEL